MVVPGQGSIELPHRGGSTIRDHKIHKGEVRELVGFIGFQADLMDILDWVEERLGKAPTADKLQQEFYLLEQEKM